MKRVKNSIDTAEYWVSNDPKCQFKESYQNIEEKEKKWKLEMRKDIQDKLIKSIIPKNKRERKKKKNKGQGINKKKKSP